MCVIVYKPKGTPIPDTLKDCWTSNPDGAGYCLPELKHGTPTGKILIKKGFMEWEDFMNSVRTIENPTERDILFHFRIATSGGVNRKFCHPFPLTDSRRKLEASRAKTNMALCHNGIISGLGNGKISDTAEYIQQVVYPLFRATNYRQNEYTDKIIENTIDGSRFATMDKDGVRLIGDWKKEGECYYSNDHWNLRKYYEGWGYYDYGYEGYSDYYEGIPDYELPKESYTDLWRLPAGAFFSNGLGQSDIVNDNDELAVDEFGLVFEKELYQEKYDITGYMLSETDGAVLGDAELSKVLDKLEYLGCLPVAQ